jgi:hypothetical protein
MAQSRSRTDQHSEQRSNNVLLLPWFVSTRSFAGSWALLLLLLFSGVGVLFMRIPVYSTGTGVIADWRNKSDSEAHGLVVVAFFPAPMVSHLAPGRTLSFDVDGQKLTRPIVDAKAKTFDRAAAASEFALRPDETSSLSELSAVAIVDLEPTPAGSSHEPLIGRLIHINYLLTNRRLGSFLPFIGGLFRD